MDFIASSQAAHRRIASFVRNTPLAESTELGQETGAKVFFKCENQQVTGSFKVRGALNRLLALTAAERERGVTAASTGNHGLGVAYGLSRFSIAGTIYVPENALPAKVDAIRRQGAQVLVSGRTCEQAEGAAREIAERTGRVFISPYNDPQVVAGQGTIGLELAEAGHWDAVFVSVGCGGLIAGIAGVLKAKQPGVKIIGCSPVNDCAMAASVQAGRIVTVDAKPTLSDGTAGGVEPGSITFEMCRDLVDEFALVEETCIREGMRWLLEFPHLLAEGAAAVALMAFRAQAERWRGKRVAIVLCGGNVGLDTLREVLR